MTRRKKSSVDSKPLQTEVKAILEAGSKPIEDKGQVENEKVYIQYPTTPEDAIRVENGYKLVDVST